MAERKPKERVTIYTCHPGNYYHQPDWKVVKGDAIETRELFINIEPSEARRAFGGSKVDKANWMRSPKSAIDQHLKSKLVQLECFKRNVAEAEEEIEQLIAIIPDEPVNC